MMETQNYWEDSSAKYESLDGRTCKDEVYKLGIGNGYCEGNLNFTIASEDDEVYTKKKVSRVSQDPMSHRIIEKRRRDRMNNCLADLSRLIPAEYLKKGRGRVEKTEIIEMAIRHMKHLQTLKPESRQSSASAVDHAHQEDSVDSVSHPAACTAAAAEHYRQGYQECLSETMNFLVEVEGYFARDTLCVQLINHLQQHCEKVSATNERTGLSHHEITQPNGNTCSQSLISPISSGNNTNCRLTNTSHNNPYHLFETNGQHITSSSSSPTNVYGCNVHSDQGSTSGVSSFGESERPLNRNGSTSATPVLTSDDSCHSNHSHSNQQEHRPAPASYKFKNSIKQRFTADQRCKSLDSPPPADYNTKHHNQHHGIPIFALHDNGSFYIPLTVEAGVLGPHTNCSIVHGMETVLHPVTISVNFNHSPPPAWSHQSPTHQV